ncbi:MAG: segregation/condensation protein A, partial [Nanoarchaeota archaeon]
KVSIYDLVKALEKALEVSRRRILTSIQPSMKVPVKPKEVTQIIKEVYARIMSFFTLDKKARLTFSKLIPSDKREDKVYTFIPLLHLANQHKIELLQEQHFGEIEILLRDEKGLAK